MEIAISDLMKALKKRWLLIFLLVVLATTATGLISFYLLKPQYQASASLLINHDNKATQSSYDAMISNDKLLKTYNQIIKSRQVVDHVIADLHLKTTAEKLSGQVEVKADNDSLITSITVTDFSPAQAALIANRFATSSIEKLNTIMGTQIFVMLDQAEVPANPTPISPRPYMNMAVAFLLAAVVGAGIAICLEFMDTTLRTEEQVEDVLDLPVLGAIPIVKPEAHKGTVGDNVLVRGVAHEN
ncbi:MAG: YveK family protein [Tumebacillaceae bacterium]